MKFLSVKRAFAMGAAAVLVAGLFASTAFAAEDPADSAPLIVGATQSEMTLTTSSDDIPTEKLSLSLAAGAYKYLSEDFSAYDDFSVVSSDDVLSIDSSGQIFLNSNAAAGKTYTAVLQAGMLEVGGIQPVKRFKVTVKALPPAVQMWSTPSWNENNRLAVSWDALPSNQRSGYQIQVSTTKSFKSKKTVKAKSAAVSKAVAGLDVTKRYYVRVRAYKTLNGQTTYGSWSDAKRSGKWAPTLDGSCELPGALMVYWEKVSKKQCTGFQVQVSLKKNFKSSKTVKVKSTASAKRIAGLKAGKKYWMRVRAYKKTGSKTTYSAWSYKSQSGKIEARTTVALEGYTYAKDAYARIAKTAKKYGWTVSRLVRSEGSLLSPSGKASVPLYSVRCTNDSYTCSVNLSPWKEVFWAYVYDKNGKTIKEYHVAMANPSYEDAMVTDLSKGILADLKKFSTKYKVPHLNAETVQLAGGDKVVIKMLNTTKKVTWDIVNAETLQKETGAENLSYVNQAMKLKVKSKTSVQLSIVKSALPYDSFHANYYLRATVDGKKHYVIINLPS